jgi:hypothetical protein
VFLSRTIAAQGIDRVPFVWLSPNGATACAIVTRDVASVCDMFALTSRKDPFAC